MKITLMTLMAIQYLNVPYKWAGNTPDGFDCSGFTLAVLRDIGIRNHEEKYLPDMTSQGIYNWISDKNRFSPSCIEQDCLLFFGRNNRNITHVAIAINDEYMIEAGGAGRESENMLSCDLLKKDARVRIKRIDRRHDLIAFHKVNY